LYNAELKRIDERIALLNAQVLILACDVKPVNVNTKDRRTLEDELKHAYCAKCISPDLKITKIIQIECRKCGRKRMITSRLDESKK
jgi:RNase P subunit RPR2